jgi:hypothetical protein
MLEQKVEQQHVDATDNIYIGYDKVSHRTNVFQQGTKAAGSTSSTTRRGNDTGQLLVYYLRHTKKILQKYVISLGLYLAQSQRAAS